MFPAMGRLSNGFLAAGLAGVTAVGAAGCAGDDGGGAGTTAAAQAPAATQPATTTPAATTPAPAATTATPASAGTRVPASDPVAKAAAASARLDGGITVQLRGTVSSAGTHSPLTGKGTVDRHSGRGMFELTTSVQGQDVPIREVMDGRSLYISSALLAGQLPGKRSWMKIDLSKASKVAGVDLTAFGTNGPSQDPAQVLDYLGGAGPAKKVGTATVRGVPTTRYKVTVDLAKAKAKATSGTAKGSIAQLAKTLGSSKATFPADVWLDAQHRVLRERVRYSATIGGVKSDLDFTTDFTAFGAKVKVDTPAASDTVDGLALLQKAAALKQQEA